MKYLSAISSYFLKWWYGCNLTSGLSFTKDIVLTNKGRTDSIYFLGQKMTQHWSSTMDVGCVVLARVGVGYGCGWWRGAHKKATWTYVDIALLKYRC